MTFDEYLKAELEKPAHESYDQNGNSPRATVMRGLWREILIQYKDLPRRFKCLLSDFEGVETPIIWFLAVPLMIVLSPALPITAAIHWHRKSIAEYRRSYEALNT